MKGMRGHGDPDETFEMSASRLEAIADAPDGDDGVYVANMRRRGVRDFDSRRGEER